MSGRRPRWAATLVLFMLQLKKDQPNKPAHRTNAHDATARRQIKHHRRLACVVTGLKHHDRMKIVRAAVGAGDGLLDRALCVAGTIIFSQIPEFMQQYLQRLGGHLDEARRQLAQFRHTAEQSGLTLDNFIHQTSANVDPAVAKLGAVMNDSAARVHQLETALTAIRDASLWTRPFVFLQHVDPAIASATWSIFRPAVPTTVEGLVYAAFGLLILLSFYHAGVKYPIRRAVRRRRERRLA